MIVSNEAQPVIEACIVNHNTSPYAELALRSLVAMHAAPGGPAELRVTVVDNHSTDEGFSELESAAREVGATLERSRWPAARSWVNSHGDVLRNFVLTHPDPDYFLFVDSDIVFDRPNGVWTMLREALENPEAWAVQARFHWMEQHDGLGSSLDIWAGQEQRVWVGMREGRTGHDYPIIGLRKKRCHPGCTLIANSPAFRRVSEVVGLSGAVVVSQDPEIAGFHDTLGLASQAMSVQGLRYILSEAAVVHFFYVSYESDPEIAAGKLADCRRRLEVLRHGSASPVAPGPWG